MTAAEGTPIHECFHCHTDIVPGVTDVFGVRVATWIHLNPSYPTSPMMCPATFAVPVVPTLPVPS